MIGKLFVCVCNLVFELYSELTYFILQAVIWVGMPCSPKHIYFSQHIFTVMIIYCIYFCYSFLFHFFSHILVYLSKIREEEYNKILFQSFFQKYQCLICISQSFYTYMHTHTHAHPICVTIFCILVKIDSNSCDTKCF